MLSRQNQLSAKKDANKRAGQICLGTCPAREEKRINLLRLVLRSVDLRRQPRVPY